MYHLHYFEEVGRILEPIVVVIITIIIIIFSSLLFIMSIYIYRVASGISMYFKAFPGGLYAQNEILAKYMLDLKNNKQLLYPPGCTNGSQLGTP